MRYRQDLERPGGTGRPSAGKAVAQPSNTFFDPLWSMGMLKRAHAANRRASYRARTERRSALVFCHRLLRKVGAHLSGLLIDGMPYPHSPAPTAWRQGSAEAARWQTAQELALPVDVAGELHRRQATMSHVGRILDLGSARSGHLGTQVLQDHLHLQACHLLRAGQLAMQLQQASLVQVGQLDDVHFPAPPVGALLARNEENLS